MISDDFKFIKPGEVRTRFAPSPTGFLHIGGARTALFNYLFAKKNQGSFVLRIEDTDIGRSNPMFEKDVLESLKWLGLEWSEGPDLDGKFGPYRQSERTSVYVDYLDKLLKKELAYRCFCSEEELETQRQYDLSQGWPWRYNGKCSQLSQKEIKKRMADGKPHIIRFKTPSKKIEFEDLVRGKLEFDGSLLGDFSIARNDFKPLYNFSVAIDDFEMRISHVIRAEEHLANTPRQILIQEALNFPRPQYAHLPLILGPDRSKLSKRHGAEAVSDFRKEGYLPETLINFMAFLGWNPGGEVEEREFSSPPFVKTREVEEREFSSPPFVKTREREIYSMASLIKEFMLERVQKSGAVFNIKRLDFLNGFYIRQKSIEKLTELCLPYFAEEETRNFDYLKKIVAIYQDRLKKLSEIGELTDFFFKDKLSYKKELLRWKQMGDKEVLNSINSLEQILSKIKIENWTKENLEKILMPEAEKMGDRGILLWPLRATLTGKKDSAGPFEIAEILEKDKTIKRLKEAKELCYEKNQ